MQTMVLQMGVGLKGNRLRAVREARAMTQEELAAALGVGQSQIWRWESGKHDPSVETLARAAGLLNVTTDYLLGLVDEPTGLLAEEDLSPMERKLIDAVRNGSIVEALKTITSISESDDKPVVSTL